MGFVLKGQVKRNKRTGKKYARISQRSTPRNTNKADGMNGTKWGKWFG